MGMDILTDEQKRLISNRGWTAYAVDPIDYEWDLLPTVKDVACKLAERLVVEREQVGFTYPRLADFIEDFRHAQRLAKETGYWEGDYRPGFEPRVIWLPDPDLCRFAYGFVWKQSNNGTTFVISPQPLEWLDGHAFKT
jgi:hypothetical protein